MILSFLFFFLSANASFAQKEEVFRLHLLSEPSSFNPVVQKNSSSTYLLSQLTCPLQKWTGTEITNWAASCSLNKKKTLAICEIRDDLKFQDGSEVLAEHYKQTVLNFLNPENPSPRADSLFAIRNARAYFEKKVTADKLGMRATRKHLEFDLENPDPDFLQDLSHPLLTATKIDKKIQSVDPEGLLSCGAYQLDKHEPSKKLVLIPQKYFKMGHPQRPKLEFLFITEDSLALQYYEKDQLDFLRRLPALHILKWKNTPDFILAEQIRLDYFALQPEWREPHLAKALAQAIDYQAWQELYQAVPRPGCFGIPEKWSGEKICWDFDVKKANAELDLSQLVKTTKKLKIQYSKQGGDDHERTLAFLQDQWKKNLKLDIAIEGQENKIFLQNLENGKILFFRKGISPARASCLAAVEKFTSNHFENYIHLKSPIFDSWVEKMHKAKNKELSAICKKALLYLRDEVYLIPTGPLYFSLLLKPKWQGVTLNNLNHLDLSQLHLKN